MRDFTRHPRTVPIEITNQELMAIAVAIQLLWDEDHTDGFIFDAVITLDKLYSRVRSVFDSLAQVG